MSADSGWNAVIHHPSELELQDWSWQDNDGEHERELPSTVDMNAIKEGGSWDPSTAPNGSNSINSEDDSDSDEESSGGSDGSCSYSDSNSETDGETSGEEEETGTNSDCSSEQSEQTFSIQETNFEQGALKLKITMKGPKKEDIEKTKKVVSKKGKNNNNRASKSSECSSEDSDSTTIPTPTPNPTATQPQLPLQEINQEDLAAILPDQDTEDAPFDGFEDSESGRLVSKAIERMSLGTYSDGNENADQNPIPVYSSTLLQQFVEKTALLSEPRKRRCRTVKKADSEYPCTSNVSPDSGILSVDNSPLHLTVSPVSPTQTTSQSPVPASKPAVNVDRVLYPPKRKPGRPAKMVSTQPRGPGRPKMKADVAEKMEKIQKNDKEVVKKGTIKTNNKTIDVAVDGSKRVKEKIQCSKKKSNSVKTSKNDKRANRSVTNRIGNKESSSLSDKRAMKKLKREKLPVRRQKQMNGEQTGNDTRLLNGNRKSLKENRMSMNKKSNVNVTNKTGSTSRRVLKENKNIKKIIDGSTNGVDVDNLISLPIENVLKSENLDNPISTCGIQVNNNNNNHCHKHHHHKHRRRLLAPPKDPIKINPCLLQELDKLIEEFTRICSLGKNNLNNNHTELPHIFRVKKLTKKRKGDINANDEQKLKRRLKKEKISSTGDLKDNKSSNANSNEQRLPLKKRHYHVSSPHSSNAAADPNVMECNDTVDHIEEAIEAAITRYGGNSTSIINKESVPVTPKKRHREPVTPDKPEEPALESKPSSQSEPQPRRKKKIVKDLRVTVTKLTAENHSIDKTDKSNKLDKTVDKDQSNPMVNNIENDNNLKAPVGSIGNETKAKKCNNDNKNNNIRPILDPSSIGKKIKRRKTINRTGFPTMKKKKKKLFKSVVTGKKSEKDKKVAVNKASQDVSSDLIKERKSDRVQNRIDMKNIETSVEKTDTNKGQLRVREDLVELESPVKFEKISDGQASENATPTTECLEMYNEQQNLLSNDESIKTEISSCVNNNNKKRKSSVSPCNVTCKNAKRSKTTVTNEQDKKQKDTTHIRKKQPRWKKKYLQEDNSKTKVLCSSYQCGKLLRRRKMPFQLPYDLWWYDLSSNQSSKLPGKNLVPSWNYKKIRTNVYYDVKPTTLYESQACECKPESGCGDDCINRMVFSECSPSLCPCGERCKNQKIQKHDWSPGLQKFMTKDKGWGVKTQQPIKPGNFILEYVGEVVSEREFKSRMATRYANDTHHYCLHLDGGLVIDGHRMGGDGRFVNHSCEPNCEMQKWSVHGLPRMALFALRDIKPAEELTYDYNFALFNPSEGQECRCGSEACRGVIGGKSQRVSKTLTTLPNQVKTSERRSVGRPRKTVRKFNTTQMDSKNLCKSRRLGESSSFHIPLLKPMSHQQRCFAQQHHCFLLRNLEKVKRMKSSVNQVQQQNNKGKSSTVQNIKEKTIGDSKSQSDAFYSQLTALTNNTARTVRTRRLAQAQDDPEVHKTAKLAKVLKELYSIVTSANDEKHQLLCTPFMNLPPKKKLPEYYEKLLDPIDLTTIDQSISTGQYKTAEHFDNDIIKLFDNNIKFFGRTSEFGIAAARLRKLYLGSKQNFVEAITEAIGSPPSQAFLPAHGSTAGEEDVIRCICGLHRDEGLMIQCERCLVWQHCDCVKADTSVESYLCERCQPRSVDLEIPLEGEEEEEGKQHYITLLRGDLQLRQGDTVYVLRDTPEKHTYKTIENPDYEQMDIFRIERLWKDTEGERFVFGHHYLRPHETYHEPTRKFYENEVVCAPLYEAVPCDLIAARCWVLDPFTYCKGRPVGAEAKHTYVCEYRVDRAARLFTKVARARHQVCTKPYAFETFPERIKHTRTYLPHSLDGIQVGNKTSKDKKKANQEHDNNHKVESNEDTKVNVKETQRTCASRTRRKSIESSSSTNLATSYIQKEQQRERLNNILLNLLQKMPCKKDPLDLSFLLERNRRNRKRPGGLNP